jgi:sialidase-1
MKNRIIYILLILFLIKLSAEAQKFKNITAVVYPQNIPIIKGVASNPILKLSIHVPKKCIDSVLTNIECQLGKGEYLVIDKVTVYETSSEHFSSDNKLVSVAPVSDRFSIPIDFKLMQGLHFLWISVELRQSSDINGMLTLNTLEVKSKNGVRFPVIQTPGDYSRIKGVVVRKSGDNNVDTYRIPGIVKTKKGTLLSVYDIRYKNGKDLPNNIDVGLSKSIDGGETWKPMQVIMDMGTPHENNGVGDPAILYDPYNERIWVAALWSKGNRSIAGSLPGLSPDTTGQLVLVYSDDDGESWSRPESITTMTKNPKWHLYFNGPGKGIAMKNGTLVFAAQYWDENKIPHATIFYSKDHGDNWIGKIEGPKSNTTESQVVETAQGTLMLNMRDNRGGYRSVATTDDMGEHWIEHASSFQTLIDPICMGSIIDATVYIKDSNKNVLFFSNPNTKNGRYNITIKASTDNGDTWPSKNSFLIDERICYGYSCLTALDKKTIGILYEGAKDLYFVKLPVGSIIK